VQIAKKSAQSMKIDKYLLSILQENAYLPSLSESTTTQTTSTSPSNQITITLACTSLVDILRILGEF
jgi:hypothetical protein